MEENKVAQKLKSLILGTNVEHISSDAARDCADRILQSPDLKVTMVEPRYFTEGVCVRDRGTISNYAFASFATEALAREYADFKNSKEPK